MSAMPARVCVVGSVNVDHTFAVDALPQPGQTVLASALTSAPGGLLHAPVSSDLPVSTLCMGQRVPEDIAPATRGRILDYIAPRGNTQLAS